MDNSGQAGTGSPESRVWMAAALLAGLLVRIIGWLSLKGALFCGIPTFDDAIHRMRAFEIMQGNWPEPLLQWGSPIYPYLAAFIWSATGQGAAHALLVQCILGLALTWVVAWALKPVLAPRERWIAAGIYAIHPLGVFFEMRFQPMMFGLALMLVVLRLLYYTDLRRADRAAAGGVLAGLGFLLQPLIFLALAVGAVWIRRRRAVAFLLAVTFLALPGLLCGYNAALPGGEANWNWSSAANFHHSIAAGNWGTPRAMTPPAWLSPGKALASANEEVGREQTHGEIARHYAGRSLRFVAERPLELVRTVLIRAALLLSGREIPDPVSPTFVLGTNARLLSWGAFLFPLFLALSALGFYQLRGEGRLAPLTAPLVALTAANLLGVHSCATRWPLIVAALPVIVTGMTALPSRVHGLRTATGGRYVLAAALLLLVLSTLDLPQARTKCDDHSEDMRYEAALVLTGQDRGGAINRLRAALRVNPRNAAAHADLAALLALEELPGAAREEFATALDIDPANAQALYGLSEILRTEKRYDAADSIATRLVTRHPRHPLYLNQLGAIKMLRGDLAMAEALFSRALELSPNYQVALINLRAARDAQKQATELAFPEEMTPPPDSPLLRLGTAAIVALRQDRPQDADSLTALGLAEHAGEALALYLRGAFLLQVDRYAEAAALLTQVVRTAPGRVLTTRLAMQALLGDGRNAAARELAVWSLDQATDDRNRDGIEALLGELPAP